MDLRRLVSAAGAGVTTFLVVGAATIEGLTVALGGEIGPGIIGVLAGVVVGFGAVLAVGRWWSAVSTRTRAALLAYGTFGFTLVFLAFLSYVNTPGVDEYLSLQRNVVIAVVVAAIAGLVT